MSEARPRYPTLDEFWRRLAVRDVEPDLRDALAARTGREARAPARLPAATVEAVCARLLPGPVPPAALAAFVDENFDRQLGRSDDKDGLLPRAQLIPLGFRALDAVARRRHRRGFADLGADQQDALLAAAERDELPAAASFEWSTWFRRVRGLALLAFGSDPRGMVFMGYPGPSYKPGHVWLDEGEVDARARRRPGYLTL